MKRLLLTLMAVVLLAASVGAGDHTIYIGDECDFNIGRHGFTINGVELKLRNDNLILTHDDFPGDKIR